MARHGVAFLQAAGSGLWSTMSATAATGRPCTAVVTARLAYTSAEASSRAVQTTVTSVNPYA